MNEIVIDLSDQRLYLSDILDRYSIKRVDMLKEELEDLMSDVAFEGARAGTKLASQRLASVLESGSSVMTTIFIRESET